MLLRRLWRFVRPQKHCVGMAAQCAAVPAVSSPPKRGKRTKPGEAINAAKSRNSARPRRVRGETKASLWVFRFHAAPPFLTLAEERRPPAGKLRCGAAPFSTLPPARRRFFGLPLQHPMPRPKHIQAIYATSPNSCIVVLGGNYKARDPAKTLCLVCTEDTAQHLVKCQWVECQSIFCSTAVEWLDLSRPMRFHIVSNMANWASNSAYGKPTH